MNNDKKVIVLGVSGGISAYKSAQLASNLFKKGYEVHVIMTKNATEFIPPLTFEVLTNNRVAVDTFDRNFEYNVNHIAIAKKADLFVCAPATANIIAKFANGIADDMLTTNYLALKCPVLIAPAMNTNMLEHTATQRNIAQLKADGVHFIESGVGYLACGDIGAGRLPEIADLEEEIEFLLHRSNELAGKKVVITAGPTEEALDPVRFITNHSTGKMGYALARAARAMGADVHLITGPTQIKVPRGVQVTSVISAKEMLQAAMNHMDYDCFIATAAVSDFSPVQYSGQKIKKNEANEPLVLHLKENTDIAAYMGAHKKEKQTIIAFAMETQNLVEQAQKKLKKKNANLVVANNLSDSGAGFAVDTNVVTLITETEVERLQLMPKDELAIVILKRMEQLMC